MAIVSKSSIEEVKVVKMAIPLNHQCESCKRQLDKGERFRAMREYIGQDPTFDVEVYRFHFKCPCCRSSFSIKSDPGRYNYVLESGAILAPTN